MPVEIRELQQLAEAEQCAQMMADSEPWITLQRDYDAALRLLTDPTREIYVAVVNDVIVGFVILVMQGAFIGYVQSVGVAPEWRRKGIGRRLIAYAEKRIFSEVPNVFICVSSFNKDARRLYERLGYQVVGELQDYVVSGYSEILLRKTIAPLAGFKGTSDHANPPDTELSPAQIEDVIC